MESSGVGCALPVWRSSMPCSGVPPFVPVRFVVVRSFLPKVHLYGSHAPLPENKRHSSFLVVHTEKHTCTPPSRLPEPTGRWPRPAVGTMIACHQGPLPLLWLCNLACVGALRLSFVVAGNRNRNTHSLNLACGSRLGRVHQRPLYRRSGIVSKMAAPCLRPGPRLVSIIRTYRSPSSPYRNLPILPISGRNTVPLIVRALPPLVGLDRPRL